MPTGQICHREVVLEEEGPKVVRVMTPICLMTLGPMLYRFESAACEFEPAQARLPAAVNRDNGVVTPLT
jgi:hypothetical protein